MAVKYRKLNERDGRAKEEHARDDGTEEEEASDWAYLPDGIVAKIGDILLAHDLLPYLSLRRVCRSWRQATETPTDTNQRFRPHKWICIHPITDLCLSNHALAEPLMFIQTRCRFLNFSTGKRIWVDIPKLKNRFIHACVDGLLVITEAEFADAQLADSGAQIRLLNPFTGAMMDYPAMSKLCAMHSNLHWWSLRPVSICFASSTSSTLIVLTRCDVAYAFPGSKDWKLAVNHNPPCNVHMAHAFFRSCTYVFSIIRTQKCVELHLIRAKVEEAYSDHVGLGMEYLRISQKDLAKHISWYIVSLVESDGELLLLSRSPHHLIIDFFLVFKVVIEEGVCGEGKATLVPVNDIGKHAILVNQAYGSLLVSTDVFPCFEPNSIYSFHPSSLTIFHPRGIPCESIIGPLLAPPGYRYWPVENIKLSRKPISLFPPFGYSRVERRGSC